MITKNYAKGIEEVISEYVMPVSDGMVMMPAVKKTYRVNLDVYSREEVTDILDNLSKVDKSSEIQLIGHNASSVYRMWEIRDENKLTFKDYLTSVKRTGIGLAIGSFGDQETAIIGALSGLIYDLVMKRREPKHKETLLLDNLIEQAELQSHYDPSKRKIAYNIEARNQVKRFNGFTETEYVVNTNSVKTNSKLNKLFEQTIERLVEDIASSTPDAISLTIVGNNRRAFKKAIKNKIKERSELGPVVYQHNFEHNDISDSFMFSSIGAASYLESAPIMLTAGIFGKVFGGFLSQDIKSFVNEPFRQGAYRDLLKNTRLSNREAPFFLRESFTIPSFKTESTKTPLIDKLASVAYALLPFNLNPKVLTKRIKIKPTTEKIKKIRKENTKPLPQQYFSTYSQ